MAAVKTTWVESLLSCSLILSGSPRFLQSSEMSTSPTKTFRQYWIFIINQSLFFIIINNPIILLFLVVEIMNLYSSIFFQRMIVHCQNAFTIYLTQIFLCQIFYDIVIMSNDIIFSYDYNFRVLSTSKFFWVIYLYLNNILSSYLTTLVNHVIYT